jgi:hypothetical protein
LAVFLAGFLLLSRGSAADERPSCVLGDSIEVAVHQAALRCGMVAKVGITSVRWAAAHAEAVVADRIVISLGANDDGIDTEIALRTIRRRLTGSVIWLRPNIRRAAQLEAITNVAAAFGDVVFDTPRPMAARTACIPRRTARGRSPSGLESLYLWTPRGGRASLNEARTGLCKRT